MPISTTITNFTKSHQKIDWSNKQTNKNTHTHTRARTSLCVNDVPLFLHQNLIVTQQNWPSPCTHKLWGPSFFPLKPSCHVQKNWSRTPFVHSMSYTQKLTFYIKKALATTSTHKFKSFTLHPWFLPSLHIVMSTNKQGALQWKKQDETLESTNLAANLSFILRYLVSLCIHLVFIDPYHVWPK
jgi:hypothetical protein